ncbi:hypothetical protein P7M00_24965, partial [Vibrio parahaemolyticus]|nr:hypothetical protein [Vibrio parahaemolyticus]MDG2713651.1 hypothetical protein [Vibrio parahaemolyticus]
MRQYRIERRLLGSHGRIDLCRRRGACFIFIALAFLHDDANHDDGNQHTQPNDGPLHAFFDVNRLDAGQRIELEGEVTHIPPRK